MRWREGLLTVPFIGRGGEPRGQGRVKWWPSMASMADGFKALKGRDGVTGSTHSRGELKEGRNGSNPIS
jgi:hypothetical protein